MLKKFRYLALLTVLILVVVSCTTFAAAKPIKVIFGHNYSTEHYYSKGIKYFKKLVEKNSKGQIVVDVFPGAQLGGPGEMLQGTRSNAQQITISALGGYISGLWPKLTTLDLPYVIVDYESLSKVIDRYNSLIDPDEMVAKTGVRTIGFFTYPLQHLLSKTPINKIEDIQGLKIGISEKPAEVAAWKALGAVPVVVTNAELYTALATGVVGATCHSMAVFQSFKLYEQNKYCALIGTQCGFGIMIINNNFWNSLTAKQKKIIQNAAYKST
jgi:TRAP-type C4-dicarboxylate transport system substrate-binding protein